MEQTKHRFCGDCKHCGNQFDNGPNTRLCLAVPARREAHFEERGKTPDAYWTAPLSWVYVNSGFAERCNWFEVAQNKQ